MGLCSAGEAPESVSRALAILIGVIVGGGGAVVMPDGDALLVSPTFQVLSRDDEAAAANLAYGEFSAQPGFQIMDSPTDHWVEMLTGLAATGVEAVAAFSAIDLPPADVAERAQPYTALIECWK